MSHPFKRQKLSKTGSANRGAFPACAAERGNLEGTKNTKHTKGLKMNRHWFAMIGIALGIGLLIVALSRSATTKPVSHRVPGQGRMQPFLGSEPRTGPASNGLGTADQKHRD